MNGRTYCPTTGCSRYAIVGQTYCRPCREVRDVHVLRRLFEALARGWAAETMRRDQR